jgi:hypothetical protein
MKRSGKETLLLALVAILWIGMALLYWPVALIFLVLIAIIRAPGKRARGKAVQHT